MAPAHPNGVKIISGRMSKNPRTTSDPTEFTVTSCYFGIYIWFLVLNYDGDVFSFSWKMESEHQRKRLNHSFPSDPNGNTYSIVDQILLLILEREQKSVTGKENLQRYHKAQMCWSSQDGLH